MSENKQFITARELQIYSFQLAQKIYKSSFKPTFIIALWRGGAVIGTYVQEFLKYKAINTDHIAIRTKSYESQNRKEVEVFNLGYILEKCNTTDSVLIIDDVFDSGRSVEKVVDTLKTKLRNNYPKELRIGVVFYKPHKNLTKIKPDFYYEETKNWLVFPHELEDLTRDEIFDKDYEVAKILFN